MTVTPTKSNLMAMKRSLGLAELGYELLDRKRMLMTREMSRLSGDVESVRAEMAEAFAKAYEALQEANMTLGQNEVFRIAMSRDTGDDLTILTRSVMGVEIPDVRCEELPLPDYGLSTTNPLLDEAYIRFGEVKKLAAKAAAVENSVERLAKAVKQLRKRANALKNIVIPDLEESIKFVTDYLAEKEREEFTTLKVIKGSK